MLSDRMGDEFLAQANKLLKGGFLSKLTGGPSERKLEEAAELYQKAGNAYKTMKRWDDAGEAYRLCASCHEKLRSVHERCTALTDAAHAFKHAAAGSARAVGLLNEAVACYCGNGKFSQAAKLQKEIAEIYEADGDGELAIESFQKAADFFTGEDNASAANQCLLKVAFFSATKEKYAEAVSIFDQIGRACLENNLLKFGAKGHFLCSIITILASGDVVDAVNHIEQYKGLDYTFGDSRECQFMEAVAKAVQESNVESFTDEVYKFDSISKLDPWKTQMLLRVKTKMSDAFGGSLDEAGAAALGVGAEAAAAAPAPGAEAEGAPAGPPVEDAPPEGEADLA